MRYFGSSGEVIPSEAFVSNHITWPLHRCLHLNMCLAASVSHCFITGETPEADSPTPPNNIWTHFRHCVLRNRFKPVKASDRSEPPVQFSGLWEMIRRSWERSFQSHVSDCVEKHWSTEWQQTKSKSDQGFYWLNVTESCLTKARKYDFSHRLHLCYSDQLFQVWSKCLCLDCAEFRWFSHLVVWF